jgi:hypothetical protein
MKVRNGFVSNSSSSSFVVLKESLTKIQKAMIIDHVESADFLSNQDENLKGDFQYYDTDSWRIIESDDWILGETSMDNFDMYSFLNYIKVNMDYVKWDDGYITTPTPEQLDFIKKSKIKYRKDKLDKLDNIDH